MSESKDTGLGCGCLVLIALLVASRGAILIPIILIYVLVCIIKFIYRKIANNFSGNNDEYSGYSGTDYDQSEPFGNGRQSRNQNQRQSKSNDSNIEFVSAVARLTGYISRGAGRITPEHIDIVSNFIDLIGGDPKIRTHLQNQFDIGKDYNFDPTSTCKILKEQLRSDFDAQTFILNLLLTLIFADNYASPEEIRRLYKVCDLLGIPRSLTDKKISEFQFTSGFRSGSSGSNSNNYRENSSNSSYRNNNDSYNESRSQSSSSNDFDDVKSRADALRILGLSSSATATEIKRQYLKLMKEYHPDRLKAKGISGKLKDEYERKCKLITSAYNYLK